MPAGNVTATITSTIGPGSSVTSLVLSDVSDIAFRFRDGAVDVTKDGLVRTFDYSALTTVTFTPASKTVVMS